MIIIPELPCSSQPPEAPPGEGAERIYGAEITSFRCQNGYEWSTGAWPYLHMECLNKKWAPEKLPACISKF